MRFPFLGSRLPILAAAVLILIGCSGIRFTEVPKPKKNTGFLYYPPKPYLVVHKSKDGSTTAEIVSLPDLSKPRWVKHVARIGTAEMGFDVVNGMITKFNSKTDSKTAETVTAIGTGALAALGGAYAAIETAGAAVTTANAALIEAEKGSGASDDCSGGCTFTIKGIHDAKNWIEKAYDVLKGYNTYSEKLKEASSKLPEASFQYKTLDEWREEMGKKLKGVSSVLSLLRAVRASVHDDLSADKLPPASARQARSHLAYAIDALAVLVDTFHIPAMKKAKNDLQKETTKLTSPAFADVKTRLEDQVASLAEYEGIPLRDEDNTLKAVGEALGAAEKDAVRVAGHLEREQAVLDVLKARRDLTPSEVAVAAAASGAVAEIAGQLRKFASAKSGEWVQIYEIVENGGSLDFRRIILD